MAQDFELQDFLPYLLNQAAEVTGLAFQKHYKDKYGMLRTEWRVLFHLGRYGDLTAKDIGAMARVHKTKISRAVAALEAKRLLTRHEMEHDRRHAQLRLTAAGKAAFIDIYKAAQSFDQDLASQFSASQVEMLKSCLIRLSEIKSSAQHSRPAEKN